MRKFLKCTIVILIIAFIVLLGIYLINMPPWIADKTVLDIRNNSKTDLSGIYLLVEKSSTFTIPKGEKYYDKKIFAPTIRAGERVVIILRQDKVSVPGMQLRLNCGGFDDIIDDHLHKESGGLHIVSVDANDSVCHETIYNRINQGSSLFSLKRYKTIDITP